MRKVVLVAVLLVAVAAPASRAATPSPAYQLAVLDHGSYLKPSDRRVRPYRLALSALTTKCVDRPRRLADMAQTSVALLREAGRRETRLTMLRSANKSVPKSWVMTYGKMKCAEVFAALVTLMTQ